MYILVTRHEYDDGTFKHNAEEFFNVGLRAVELVGNEELGSEDCVGYVIYDGVIIKEKSK
jgi:hypothetical protein